MTRVQRTMAEKNLDLIFEFERYVSEHPSFAKQIPQNAIVVLQVKVESARCAIAPPLGTASSASDLPYPK